MARFVLGYSLATVLWPGLFLVNRWHPFYGQVFLVNHWHPFYDKVYSWLFVVIRSMARFDLCLSLSSALWLGLIFVYRCHPLYG